VRCVSVFVLPRACEGLCRSCALFRERSRIWICEARAAGKLNFYSCNLVVVEELVVCATWCSPLHGSLSHRKLHRELLLKGSGVEDRSYLTLRISHSGEPGTELVRV
jgi:hypothetical protein